MSLTLMLALQAAATPAAPPALVPVDFDLARYRPLDFDPGIASRSRACAAAETGTILVCGRRPAGGAYPMAEMARLFAERRLVAETRLFGNVIGDVHGESVALDRGAVSNRAMVRLRVPF